MADDSILNDPNPAGRLRGKSLAEAFRLAVIEDPEVQELARGLSHVPAGANYWLDVAVPTRCPGGAPRSKACQLLAKNEATLAPDLYSNGSGLDWEYGDYSWSRLSSMAARANGRVCEVPTNWCEETRPFVKVLATKYDRFFDLLRNGSLVGKGFYLGKPGRELVDPSIWGLPDKSIDFGTGHLYRSRGSETIYESISLELPATVMGDAAGLLHSINPSARTEGPAPKRGAPSQAHWDTAVFLFFNSWIELGAPKDHIEARQRIIDLMRAAKLNFPDKPDKVDPPMMRRIPHVWKFLKSNK